MPSPPPQRSTSESRLLMKVILIGATGAGKTALMNRYANKMFRENYQATIGTDFLTQEITMGGRRITIQIVDTVGQERFRNSLGVTFYRGSDACMLVFDVSDRESFESLGRWREEFLCQAKGTNERQSSLLAMSEAREEGEAEPFPFAVLCNKADLPEEQHAVRPEEIEAWCAANGNIPIYRTSAKDGTNVERAFEEVAARVLAAEGEVEQVEIPEIYGASQRVLRESVNIHSKPSREQSSSGCC